MIGAVVSDIKQYFYCPRIIYYNYCLPVPRKITEKMTHGEEGHDIISLLERRRKLKEYGLDEGERRFNLFLESERMGLRGALDLLIIANDRYFPVEFKYTDKKVSLNHKCQLASYAFLVEDVLKVSVEVGFIYRVPQKDIVEVRIDDTLRSKVTEALNGIRKIVTSQALPKPTVDRGKCIDCEFRKYCRDIL